MGLVLSRFAMEGFVEGCLQNTIPTELSGDCMDMHDRLNTQMKAHAWLCRLQTLLATCDAHTEL